ncbi:hypothetical protein [Roseivirga sp.]|uniref:hypothetical protein n=1 Tax=Roseivirga sp. TaxID=1964215 RepID=UPI003B8DCDF7
MGVTRLKRKARRNKQTAAKRNNSIKQLTAVPVIKNIDRDALIASFPKAEAPKAKAEKKADKVEEPKAEVKKEAKPKKAKAPKEEVKAEETTEAAE